MRWFKHYTDNHRGQGIQFLFDELGHFGVAGYWILVEMCAEKLNKYEDHITTEVDCEFSFHRRVVESALRAKSVAVERLLNAGSTSKLFRASRNGNQILISMPILLDLLERNHKKMRFKCNTNDTKTHLEQNRIDIEQNRIDIEKGEKTKKVTENKSQLPTETKSLIAFYCEAWKSRYNSNPPIGGKEAGIFRTLVKDLGFEKAKNFVNAYLQMPDPWFVTKRHDAATLRLNLNSVEHFITTGKLVTRKDVNELDKRISYQNTIDALRRGEI